MAKTKTSVYFCQNCGFESSKWMGQCPGCEEWNTFVEEVVENETTVTLEEVLKENVVVEPVLPKEVKPVKSKPTLDIVADMFKKNKDNV